MEKPIRIGNKLFHKLTEFFFFVETTTANNTVIMANAKIIHDGNSGTEGEGVGFVVIDSVGASDCVGEDVGINEGVGNKEVVRVYPFVAQY